MLPRGNFSSINAQPGVGYVLCAERPLKCPTLRMRESAPFFFEQRVSETTIGTFREGTFFIGGVGRGILEIFSEDSRGPLSSQNGLMHDPSQIPTQKHLTLPPPPPTGTREQVTVQGQRNGKMKTWGGSRTQGANILNSPIVFCQNSTCLFGPLFPTRNALAAVS